VLVLLLLLRLLLPALPSYRQRTSQWRAACAAWVLAPALPFAAAALAVQPAAQQQQLREGAQLLALLPGSRARLLQGSHALLQPSEPAPCPAWPPGCW